jgi:hypothetical protein
MVPHPASTSTANAANIVFLAIILPLSTATGAILPLQGQGKIWPRKAFSHILAGLVSGPGLLM